MTTFFSSEIVSFPILFIVLMIYVFLKDCVDIDALITQQFFLLLVNLLDVEIIMECTVNTGGNYIEMIRIIETVLPPPIHISSMELADTIYVR